MTVGILSADPGMSNFLNETLGEYADRKYLEMDCQSYSNGREYQNARQDFDLLFVDEGFDHRSSLENARRIRNQDPQVALTLMAPNSEKVFEAFLVQAHRYLVKPITQTSVFEAVDGCRRSMYSNQIILVKVAGSHVAVASEEIFAIEADGKDSRILTRNRAHPTTSSFAQIKVQLPEEYFFIVHRSYVVNMSYIRSFDSEHVELINGLIYPLSRRRKVDFYSAYTQYVKRHSGL